MQTIQLNTTIKAHKWRIAGTSTASAQTASNALGAVVDLLDHVTAQEMPDFHAVHAQGVTRGHETRAQWQELINKVCIAEARKRHDYAPVLYILAIK